MNNRIYLDLGSNIAPEQNLPAAIERLAQSCQLIAVSSVWETRPLGMPNQPNFLNAAALVESNLTAGEFKQQVIRQIERALGRVRGSNKNAPRTIDIDIMLFNEDILDLEGRPIPSPEIVERSFVAAALAEIAPDYRHPETGEALQNIAARFEIKASDMKPRPDVSRVLAQFAEKRLNVLENRRQQK